MPRKNGTHSVRSLVSNSTMEVNLMVVRGVVGSDMTRQGFLVFASYDDSTLCQVE